MKPGKENSNYLLVASQNAWEETAAWGSALPKAFLTKFLKIPFESLERKKNSASVQ